VEHRQTGVLVAARDSVALAKAIEDTLNPTIDFVSDMVDRAEKTAKNMTWETSARQMIALYQDALTKNMAPNTGAPCEVSAHEPQRRTA
jgi:glycosyltransferase involved in cell wall biosynthesis